MRYRTETIAAMQAAQFAGRKMRSGFNHYHAERKRFVLDVKASHDSSSADDRIAEGIIKRVLFLGFPDYAYYGEESGRTQTDSRYEWIVDPTDGTTQKALHNPY